MNQLLAGLGVLALVSAACAASVVLRYCWNAWYDARALSALPWVGLRNELFPTIRACLRNRTDGLRLVFDGYQRYSKNGRFFVTPCWWSRCVVAVPPEHLPWFIKELDNKGTPPQKALHTKVQSVVLRDQPKGEFVHNSLMPGLKRFSPADIWALIQQSFAEENLGGSAAAASDGCWTTASIMEDVIAMPLTRMLVGAFYGNGLDRDTAFVHNSIKYICTSNMFTYKVSAFVPEILYPVLYGAVALQHDYYKWKFDRQLVPLVKRRFAEMDAVGGASSKPGSGPPPDLLSYYIKAVSKSKDPKDRDPYVASARFSMILSGFSFATLSGALFAVLSKLVGRKEDIAVLESEAARAVAKGEEWTAQSVASLVHLDSFIKEVLRHITFNGFGLALMRCVDAAEGIKLPGGAGTSGDIVLPRGTWVGMPVDAMHRDDSVFEAADEFRPWRFVELAQRQQHQGGEEELTKAFLRNSMIATTDEYLAFGRGKATCPGRFFASDVLKLWLAYIVLNYDIAAPAEAMPSDGGNVSMRIRRKRRTSAPRASH